MPSQLTLLQVYCHSVQESFYTRIADRYLAFCTEAGDRDGLRKEFAKLAPSRAAAAASQSNTATSCGIRQASIRSESLHNLVQILDALRKLREGIVASKRRDDFARQVYLFNIRLGILAASYESYHAPLIYLLRVIRTSHSLTSVELQEAVAYLVLDAACRRGTWQRRTR